MQTILLRNTDYRNLPWKNGLGFTTEYGIEPAAADFTRDRFLWRISSARVNSAGPFSLFPGYERLITVVRGGEMILRYVEVPQCDTVRVGHVQRFSGDLHTSCELPEGAIEDFNIIVQRGACDARMHIHPPGRAESSIEPAGDWIWTFCLVGTVEVSGAYSTRLLEGDSVKMVTEHGEGASASQGLRLRSLEPGSIAITAAISRT